MAYLKRSWDGTGGGFSFCPSLGNPSLGFIVSIGLGGEQPRAEAECWTDDHEDQDEDCNDGISTSTGDQLPNVGKMWPRRGQRKTVTPYFPAF